MFFFKNKNDRSIFFTLMALAFLSGCKEKSPSESTIKNRIKEAISSCKVLSVSNVEKKNGFPNGDNAYIVDVSFVMNYSPTTEISENYKKYLTEEKKMNERLAEVKKKYPEIESKINSFDCRNNVMEAYVDGLMDRIFNNYRPLSSLVILRPPNENPEIVKAYTSVHDTVQNLNAIFDETKNQQGGLNYNLDIQTFLKKAIEATIPVIDSTIYLGSVTGTHDNGADAKALLRQLKFELANYSSSYKELPKRNECMDSRTNYIEKNKELINDNINLESRMYRIKSNLQHSFDVMSSKGCLDNEIERDLTLPILIGLTRNSSLENYINERSETFEGKLNMINSDNGWVLSK